MKSRKKAVLPDDIPLTPKLRYRREHNYLSFLQEYQKQCNEKNKVNNNERN